MSAGFLVKLSKYVNTWINKHKIKEKNLSTII